MRPCRSVILSLGLAELQLGCGGNDGSAASSSQSPTGSEVATSVVSGALNSTAGSTVGANEPRGIKKSPIDELLQDLNPIRTAFAATWTCTGGSLSPMFTGPGKDPYTFTPVSCSVDWKNGKSASAKWSSTFELHYGMSCDSTHAFFENQDAACTVTRTTAAGGNTRTLTGPDGNAYAITHDTNGTGTGWDSTVSPAPSGAGVIVTCGADGCAKEKTLTISGSHLTGTVTPTGGTANTIWDHTVSTGASGITVSRSGVNRVVTGTVSVEHNLAKFTSTTTFNSVGYGEVGCCFPTTGTVTTQFTKGADAGKTESITFSNVCGEASLTRADGTTVDLTLEHCI